MSQWQVIVGNVGTVYDGTNGFEAVQRFNNYIKESKEPVAGWRGAGEPVTLMRDGEPFREYDPDAGWFYVEITDTWGGPSGETNYAWVERSKVRAKTHIGALLKATYRRGWRHDSDIPDEYATKRFNLSGAAVCAFVSHYDREAHGNHLNLDTVE